MRDPPKRGDRRAVADSAAGAAEPPAPARRRLEIVHESLLTHWPRLVRWRAQDEEGAVLRDQLRQAAELWQQHGRAGDFLWTGTGFREFQLWRERYPGGLTALEEAFASAMTSLAQRRRRRRRLALAAVIAALSMGLALVAVLRQQAVAQARRAEAEAHRAEASKLLALGQLELESNPTGALAYAIKSLELDDSHAARLFALRALAAGPPAFLHTLEVRGPSQIRRVGFSPDGAWAAVAGTEGLHAVSREGGPGLLLEPFPSGTGSVSAVFDAAAEHLYAAKDGVVKVWSVPAFELSETRTIGGRQSWLRRAPSGVLATTQVKDEPREVEFSTLAIGSPPLRVGRIEGVGNWDLHLATRLVAIARSGALYIRPLGEVDERARRIGTYEGQPMIRFHPAGDRLAAYDSASGKIRLWAARPGVEKPLLALAAPFEPLADFTFDSVGRRLAAIGATPRGLRVDLWDLEAPLTAAARSFPASFGGFLEDATFTPDGDWLATANRHAVCFWPMRRDEPRVFVGHRVGVSNLKFTPDGGRLVSVDRSGEVREWALEPGGSGRVLAQSKNWSMLDVDRQGRFLAISQQGGALIVPLGEGESRALKGFDPATEVLSVAIDPGGRRVAAASLRGPKADKVIRVWDLETGEVWTLGPIEQAGEGFAGQTLGLGFLADGSLVSAGEGGLRLWSLPAGTSEVVAPTFVQSHLKVFPQGRSVAHIVAEWREARGGDAAQAKSVSVAITDLATRTTRILRSHGDRVMTIAVDPSEAIIVSAGHDGIVRVGLVSGEEPHLLIGHEGWVHTVEISPDGRWIASAGDDRTVRLWPMPDLSEPPLHTLPLDQLLAKLRSLTNVRVVEESASTISAWLRTGRGSGYELDLEPFPGWSEVPRW